MNKSTKLTDTLDSTKIVKKYFKYIKDADYKRAALLAKLFPYRLTKPAKVDMSKEGHIDGLFITEWNKCENCKKLAAEEALKNKDPK